LDIAPGVEVQFMENYRLTVNGILDANGTDSDNIVFKSNDGSRKGTVLLDVTSEKNIHDLRDHIVKKYGRLDVLINNANHGIEGFDRKHIHKGNEMPIQNLLF